MANVIDSLVNFFQDKFAGQGYSPTQSPQHGVNTTPVDPVKVNWEGMPPRTGVGGGGGGGTDFAREVNWKGIEASKGVPQPTPTAPSAPSGTIPKGFAQPGTTGFAERAAGARDLAKVAQAGNATAAPVARLGLGGLAKGLAKKAGWAGLIYTAADMLSRGLGYEGPEQLAMQPFKGIDVPEYTEFGGLVNKGEGVPNTGVSVPSPAANIKPAEKADMQYKAGDIISGVNEVQKTNVPPNKPNSPIDESQFKGPSGKGVNYKLDNAGNMVPESAGGVGGEIDYDQQLQNVLSEMRYLSGLVVPARSGYLGDTIAENKEIYDRQKQLEKIAATIMPLTKEGIKAAAQGVPLSPEAKAQKIADARYKNAQAEALEQEDSADLKDEKDMHKEWIKFGTKKLEADNTLTEEDLYQERRKAGFREPIARKYRLKDPNLSHIEKQVGKWSGRETYIDTRTGEEVDPQGKAKAKK